MRRLLRGVALGVAAVAASAGVVACGGGEESSAVVRFEFTGAAASVDGFDIDAAELGELIAAFRRAPAALELAIGAGSPDQPSSDQPKPAVVATLLQSLIYERVVNAELERRGATVPQADRDIAETQTSAVFGDSLDGEAELREHLVSSYAAYVTLDKLLTPPPPDEATLRAVYDADPVSVAVKCETNCSILFFHFGNQLLEILRDGRVRVMGRESPVDGAVENNVLARKQFD